MTATRTLLAPVILWAALGLSPASAQTCTQWVDYPLTIDYHTPSSFSVVDFGNPNVHARFRAWRTVDATMYADLQASVAAGCVQQAGGFTIQTRQFTQGFCTAWYSGSSYVYGYRPRTGRQWLILDWHESHEQPRNGGEFTQALPHDDAALLRWAVRARVGDEVSVVTSANHGADCWGFPGSNSRAESSYGWGDSPAPFVRIWLP